jgi:hypothetical protein
MSQTVLRIRIGDPVFFYPRIGDEFFSDSGSRIPDPEGMFFGEIFLNYLKNPCSFYFTNKTCS